MNSRRKIVWIAHLDNKEISSWFKADCSYEFAPWIWEFAMLFKDDNNVHITLLVPHRKARKTMRVRYSDSVDFIFFPDYRVPGFGELSLKLNTLFNFPLHSLKIRSLVRKIKPAIVHLFGAENPHYALSILKLKERYPIYLTIQGIVEKIQPQSEFDLYRHKVERQIIKALMYFGTRDEEMENHILDLNKNAIFLQHNIAIKKPQIIDPPPRTKYDLAYYARIVPAKGIEDVLSIVHEISKSNSSIRAVIMGKAEQEYEMFLKDRISELGIEKNIDWKGVLSSIDLVHENVLSSKIVVLPTFSDTIPGTILESLQLKVPVLTYAVGGIPQLNSRRESVKMVQVGEINDLIEEAKNLINSEEKRKQLVNNGKVTYEERWGDNIIREQILNNYNSILG